MITESDIHHERNTSDSGEKPEPAFGMCPMRWLLYRPYNNCRVPSFILPVLHCQVLGDQSVLSDMRCATAQDSAAVEHQTGQDIGTTRVQNRARATCQRDGPKGLAEH